MNILITGATGYIGQHLVTRLIKMDHQCFCIVRDTDKACEIFPKSDNIKFFAANITKINDLQKHTAEIRQADCIIHCAGLLAKWNSTADELYSINSKAGLNLLNVADKINLRHFICISAGGVTGPVAGPPADEMYQCNPFTLYEKSKYEGEKNIEKYCYEFNIPFTILRPTFTYGPADPHKLALFRLVNKGLILTFGGGESVNHPVYIDDLIEGICLSLEKGGHGQTYIIGGGKPVSKKEFQETIAQVLNKKVIRVNVPKWLTFLIAHIMEGISKVFHINPVISLSRAIMMCNNFGYNIEKAKKELGYQPKYDLKTGMINTINYYKQNNLL